MRYYAVAVGRQQRVTSKYREFKYLIRNYPDAYYVVTEDYERAEEFIRKYNESVKKRPSHAYEENVSYKPSFQTRYFSNTSVNNTIWISAQTKVKDASNVFNEDFQVFVQNLKSYSASVSLSISTPAKLNADYDKYADDLIGNKNMNYYNITSVKYDMLHNSPNQLILNTLTDVLNTLHEKGQETVLICTDSHYLTNVILRDMTRRRDVHTIPLAFLTDIILLYKAMSNFEKIFVTRYSSQDRVTIHHKVLNHNYVKGKNLLEVKN